LNPSSGESGSQAARQVRTAIIGAGFSGLGMARALVDSGDRDFIVFEREPGPGGTWWLNDYPGCACDVPSHLYSLSFELNPDWTRRYPPRKEIQEYLAGMAASRGLDRHILYGNPVESMTWSDSGSYWEILDGQGRRWKAGRVVAGMGGLSRPSRPDLPGLDAFRGPVFHSQQWDHDCHLEGKRVAVIGTGASAIQFVPRIQPRVRQLDVYQRTPPWILPRRDRVIPGWLKGLFAAIPLLMRLDRYRIYWLQEFRVLGLVVSTRLAAWHRYRARAHLRRQVADEDLRRALVPDYEMGCKRVLLSDDYYPALDRENANLVDSPVTQVDETGITDATGRHRPADVIILATGFQATSPVPWGMIAGKGGQDLARVWESGPEAYKGTVVAGFPNLFMLMGPNTALGHSSVLVMIESQIRYINRAFRYMDQTGTTNLEVLESAQQQWNRKLHIRLQETVWNRGGCKSWYIHAGSGRNTTLWPGFTWEYDLRTRRFDKAAFQRRSQSETGS